MHVDQAREQGLAAHVDVLDVGAPAHRPRIRDRADPSVIADEDRRMLDIAAGLDIEIAVGGDDTVSAGAAVEARSEATNMAAIRIIERSSGQSGKDSR